ncbi:MAG: acyl-CoA dehydratase activase [Clostridiales Family XIII bacterium]|nr:acyl-CoA dehydratase activase [Clostridiales Family XIII bacterium]
MGLDIGSATSKCVVLRLDGAIIGKAVVAGGVGTEGAEQAKSLALQDAGILSDAAPMRVAATGYGRHLATDADGRFSELSCHALGALRLFPEARTVIDIGGQDSKVLRVSERGTLESFAMNDKCAAGTGRFLEEIARALNIPVGEMAELAASSGKCLDISSTCVVFAESEVVSHLARGASRADVLGGIFRSIAARVGALAQRAGICPMVVMTGGVAMNAGVREALADELGMEISVSPLSQHAGALGAALRALAQT